MDEFLEENDPYDHLVTTSVALRNMEGLLSVPQLDMNKSHPYLKTKQIPEIIPVEMEGYALKHQNNTFYGWINKQEGIGKPETIEIRDLEDGAYNLKIYDTTPGEFTGESEITVINKTAMPDSGIIQPGTDLAFVISLN